MKEEHFKYFDNTREGHWEIGTVISVIDFT
jgi:hypothetical protein